MIQTMLIFFAFLVIVGIDLYIRLRMKKQAGETYRIKIGFASGVKTKLVLNAEQHEQFQVWLKGIDGIFEIGDDEQKVSMYRQYVCLVEVKKK